MILQKRKFVRASKERNSIGGTNRTEHKKADQNRTCKNRRQWNTNKINDKRLWINIKDQDMKINSMIRLYITTFAENLWKEEQMNN